MSDRFVVGRDRELAQLDLAIGNGRDGLRLAMLSGPSGLGKTTLADVALQNATARGFDTVAIRGRAGSLSTPFAPLMEALPELGALLAVTSNADADADQAGMALVQLVTELAGSKPLLIVIDDAQALDESTIGTLPFLSGIPEAANVTLLFVEQTDAIGIPDSYRSYVEGLLARRIVSHLQLGPMSDEGLRLVVQRVLDVEAAEVPAEIITRAQGNPWFAKELAASWSVGSSDIPSTIAAAATSRLHSLDQVGQDVVSTISVCAEGAHIAWLETLTKQGPREFVGTMEAVLASGVVREDGEILTIAHPLMQQAIADELSAAMKRATHLELVAAIEQAQLDPIVTARACAFHLSQAGRRDDAVERYIEAARTSVIVGKLHEARADYLMALGLENRVEQRIDALRQVASLSTQLVSEDAADYWQELGRLAASSHDDRLYAFALYQAYFSSGCRLVDLLQRASNLSPEHNGWAALARGTVAYVEGAFDQAIPLYESAVELGVQEQDRALQAVALRYLAVCNSIIGNDDVDETYRAAINLFIELRSHDRVILTWLDFVGALIDRCDLGAARQEAETADQYVMDLGIDHFRTETLGHRAFALDEAGDLESAFTLINEAVSHDEALRNNPTYSNEASAFVAIFKAKVANDMGIANAGDIAARGEELANAALHDNWKLQSGFETYRAEARRVGIDKCIGYLDGIEANEEPIFVANAAAWTLRMSVLTDCAAGIERVREIRAGYDKWDIGKRVQLLRDEIDAVLKVVDGGDPIALNAIANAWSEVGCALDALKVNAMSGAFLVRRGDKEAAKTFLQTAKNGLQTCGASGDADLVAALLRQTGARSRAKSRTTSVGPLTKRELEIARLVASGLKNSEVAGTLFLAEKTVAAHLSNIYGKVEVRSRVQLGQWIRANDTEFDAALVG